MTPEVQEQGNAVYAVITLKSSLGAKDSAWSITSVHYMSCDG